MSPPSEPAAGDVVFWHDPDGGACSGLRRVTGAGEESLALTGLDGQGLTEALRAECTPVADCDVVGADEAGRWEFWDAARQAGGAADPPRRPGKCGRGGGRPGHTRTREGRVGLMTAVKAIGEWLGVRRYDAGSITRWVLWGDRHRDDWGVYLHRLTGDDPGGALHDHPWAFLSLVLRGWYRETTTAGGRTDPAAPLVRRWYGPGRLLCRRPHQLHRVEVPAGRPGPWSSTRPGAAARAPGSGARDSASSPGGRASAGPAAAPTRSKDPPMSPEKPPASVAALVRHLAAHPHLEVVVHPNPVGLGPRRFVKADRAELAFARPQPGGEALSYLPRDPADFEFLPGGFRVMGGKIEYRYLAGPPGAGA